MKLLPLHTIENLHAACRFKQSPVSHLVAALLFLSISLGMVWWHIAGDLPVVILFISGGGCALFSWMCLATFKKSLATDNWIVSLNPQHVQIKFRSYLNAHFPPDDPQVAQFQLTEIQSAGITKQTIVAPGSNNHSTTSFHTFLDLHIEGNDLLSLKEQLKYERTLKVPIKGRFVTSSSKSLHYPVSVVGPQTVRIEWRSPSDRVIPGIKAAIKQLSRLGVTIEPLQTEKLDCMQSSAKRSSEHATMEDQILHLAERGNTLQAIKLTRRTLGLSLTESKAFVEDLLQ